MLDLQKASMLKRISAFILDFILLATVIVGFAFLLSAVTGYDSYNQQLDGAYTKYEEEYGVSFDMSYEDYEALPEDAKKNYDNATTALNSDPDARQAYDMVINLTLVITSISILLGYVLLELIVPLLFKNGQTIGKKIFGIALMRNDGVKISTMMLFVRTILGKYTIETMVPVLIAIMVFFGGAGIIGLIVIALIAVLQIVLLFVTKTRSVIHDLLSYTVAVDMQSQMIFNSAEELLEYKKSLHADIVADSDYK
ncbi:MAG: RDD family protein [Clostridia bacterium]|nr:RDD family protein [Clostridia bacterium]